MIIWIVASIAAFFIKGLCGFANTLVFDSVLGFSVDNTAISPVEILLGYPSNIILAVRHRAKLKLKVWLPASALMLAGSIPGAILLRNVNAQYVKLFFGFVVVAMGIQMILQDQGILKNGTNPILLTLTSILAGLLCGLFGVGALLAAYVTEMTDDLESFKANITIIFAIENTVRIITYILLGLITWASLKLALILAPVMLLSLFAGMKSAKVLDEKLARKLVLGLLVLTGLMLIVTNL